ncbi:acyltransferase family protein [uncultured Polaribacter sp.]|uniref:acyltransferase family protein n=1 Tax=uncultured Polaribacter sp. TaxID=174711 RepID=UPI00261D0468|nr:acyltransferase family protein [uncultured Polaribacter sp.]
MKNKPLDNKRISWIDQVKGFGIILVVYGHNFPAIENYIYSFHMPLFFMLAGMFHPKKTGFNIIRKRAKQILVPYFLWSLLLFIFWYFIGRKFGESSLLDLSPVKNFIGIFFSQGDTEYMNWGIPMWFLPCLFLTFLIFYFLLKFRNTLIKIVVLLISILIGFMLPKYFNTCFFWSFDVSLVALSFYALGFYGKKKLLQKNHQKEYLILFLVFIFHLILSFLAFQKVDMYRSIYGNEFFFLLNSFCGILFWILLFKKFNRFSFLSFLGRNTIPILALQIRSITFIKAVLFFLIGIEIFDFNEFEKIVLVLFQLIIMYPIILLVNKYAPIFNGKN